MIFMIDNDEEDFNFKTFSSSSTSKHSQVVSFTENKQPATPPKKKKKNSNKRLLHFRDPISKGRKTQTMIADAAAIPKVLNMSGRPSITDQQMLSTTPAEIGLVGWLVGCLVGWLVGWLVGRLVGSLVQRCCGKN